MKRYITSDDFKDIFIKGMQRGWNFVISKIHFSGKRRTITAFDNSREHSSNFWDIPYVKKRWNRLLSGNEKVDIVDFITINLLKDKRKLKLLSLGSGTCETEIKLAKCDIFKSILCVDLSKDSIQQAKNKIAQEHLKNIEAVCADIYKFDLNETAFDVVLFKSSLHHFKNVEHLLLETVIPNMSENGLLIIDEYVGPNRLQYSKKQILTINKGIQLIPKKFRKIHKTPFYKNRVSGSGVIRMKLSDPSECIDSESILPAIHKMFTPLIEKPMGSNILMYALKDIAHHFYTINSEKKEILNALFALEDDFLIHNPSDIIFGVYELNNTTKKKLA